MAHTVRQLVKAFNKAQKEEIAAVGLKYVNPDRIPTGFFTLDLSSGGGIPRGRVTYVWGSESSMKTSLCLKTIANAQRLYPKETCVFIDVENHLVDEWARTLGVDTDKLVYVQPDNAEQVVNIVETFLHAKDIGVIVIDSIAAMISVRELKVDAETANVGTSGLVVNKLYRKMSRGMGVARREGRNPTVMAINQTRYKMQAMGNPETCPGGPSFNFISSLTIRTSARDVMDSKVHAKLPAYKEGTFRIKKHKVPITNPTAEVKVALVDAPHLGIKTGETSDTNAIINYSQKLGIIQKSDKEKCYLIFDVESGSEIERHKRLIDIKDKILEDVAFADLLRGMIFSIELRGEMITPEEK